jgi:hypothetical protein
LTHRYLQVDTTRVQPYAAEANEFPSSFSFPLGFHNYKSLKCLIVHREKLNIVDGGCIIKKGNEILFAMRGFCGERTTNITMYEF